MYISHYIKGANGDTAYKFGPQIEEGSQLTPLAAGLRTKQDSDFGSVLTFVKPEMYWLRASSSFVLGIDPDSENS